MIFSYDFLCQYAPFSPFGSFLKQPGKWIWGSSSPALFFKGGFILSLSMLFLAKCIVCFLFGKFSTLLLVRVLFNHLSLLFLIYSALPFSVIFLRFHQGYISFQHFNGFHFPHYPFSRVQDKGVWLFSLSLAGGLRTAVHIVFSAS